MLLVSTCRTRRGHWKPCMWTCCSLRRRRYGLPFTSLVSGLVAQSVAHAMAYFSPRVSEGARVVILYGPFPVSEGARLAYFYGPYLFGIVVYAVVPGVLFYRSRSMQNMAVVLVVRCAIGTANMITVREQVSVTWASTGHDLAVFEKGCTSSAAVGGSHGRTCQEDTLLGRLE